MKHASNSSGRTGAVAALAAIVLAGCGGGNSGPTKVGSGTTVQPPPALPTVALNMKPQAVRLGESALLTWSSTSAAQCRASGAWNGAQALTNTSGISTGAMSTAGVYSYGVTCTGPGGSDSAVQTLMVGQVAAPMVSVQLNPRSIQPGQTATLRWSSANALSCTGSGGTRSDAWAGAQAANGSLPIGPVSASGSYSYTFACTGPGGTGTETSVLTVSNSAPPPPPLVTLSASAGQISAGATLTLAWNVSTATSCNAVGGVEGDGWSGVRSASNGNAAVGPLNDNGSYGYTLNCSGSGGSASANATVLVGSAQANAPSVQITVNPTNVVIGKSGWLTWVTGNVTSCTASGSWGGSQPLTASAVSTGTLQTLGTYSYTLTCSGPAGRATATASLTVVPPPPTIVAFIASPANLQLGESTRLGWVTTGATSCSGAGGTAAWVGARPTTSLGTAIGPINAAGGYVFSLTCQGPGGSAGPQFVTVNVSAAQPAAQIRALTIAPVNIPTGQSATIAWSSANATACTASGGTSGDGWAGPVATSSLGVSVGPISAAGSYTYTLACNGPGGPGTPASATLSVGATAPPATITSFAALPSGRSVTLSWSSANATSCLASGGTGADGWSGPQASASAGTVVGLVNLTGTVTYTLTCSGAGGSSGPISSFVTVTMLTRPAVVLGFTATPNAVNAGDTTVIAWAAADAMSCTAGGGSGSDGWNGTQLSPAGSKTLGPFAVAGRYTYTLGCLGAVGQSLSAAVTLAVGASTPAGISTFTATPSVLLSGQSATLAWNANNAAACVASGGTDDGGWGRNMPTSNSGLTIGPINSTGVFAFTLACTGAGGSSGPSSALAAVYAAAPPAAITAFAALPAAVLVGQSAALTWDSTNSSACTASGGSGADGWTGTLPTSSIGQVVGPFTATGTVTYTLNCSGAGGASAPASVRVTVSAPLPGPPGITFLANGAASTNIQPGASVTLGWSTTNATSCVASGGSGADGWAGAQPTVSAGTSIGPIKTPGIYAYTLTCTGPGGSSSATVVVTVISSISADCGVGVPTTALLAPAGTVSSAVNGLCLLGCGVTNPNNVIDSDPTNYASLSVALGVAAFDSLSVTDTTTSYPAGRQVGFLVADPGQLLTLSLIPSVTVRTLLNGTLQESATAATTLQLSALGLFANPDEAFISFQSAKPFNEVRLELGSLVSAAAALNAYQACVSLQ